MLRMRHSPVSCVSTISCVLMYFSGLPSSVLGGGDDPGGIAAVERDAKRAPFGFDLALEFDVCRQMVGFVFGAGFDLSRFHENRIWCDEAHHGGGVAGGDPSVESLDDRCHIRFARWCRRRRARRKPRQEGGQSVATNPCGSHRRPQMKGVVIDADIIRPRPLAAVRAFHLRFARLSQRHELGIFPSRFGRLLPDIVQA